MAYDKPWKSYQDQLDQLIQRGMIVTDRAKALHYLERIGYYRLSGYWYRCCRRLGAMGMVIRFVKVTGNKKPLSSSTTEVAKPKGAVLFISLNNLLVLSNLLSARQLLKLTCSNYGVLGNSYVGT
jgi:hypothetical protein